MHEGGAFNRRREREREKYFEQVLWRRREELRGASELSDVWTSSQILVVFLSYAIFPKQRLFHAFLAQVRGRADDGDVQTHGVHPCVGRPAPTAGTHLEGIPWWGESVDVAPTSPRSIKQGVNRF